MQHEEETIIQRALEQGILSDEDIEDCSRTVASLERLGVEKSLFEALGEHGLLTDAIIAELQVGGDQTAAAKVVSSDSKVENTAEQKLRECLFGPAEGSSGSVPRADMMPRAKLTAVAGPAAEPPVVEPPVVEPPVVEPPVVESPVVEPPVVEPPVVESPVVEFGQTMNFAEEELSTALEPVDESRSARPPERRSSGMTALDIEVLMGDIEDQETAATVDARPRSSTVSDCTAELIGQVIGGCSIESKLGQGAMGTVYKATHLALQKTVAVKVLNSVRFCEKKQIEQFFEEARSAAAIEHQNIVTVHDVGSTGSHYFLVMQYIEGQSVEDRILDRQPLEMKEAVGIVLQAAKGLAVAHKKGIVHRDIKPANLMLTKNGQVKIADFGLAYRSEDDADATGGVEVMGTPSYMSPEQIDGRQVDHRSDLYALGVTLYFLLTGRKPFEGSTPMEVLLKHVSEKPDPVCKVNPKVPKAAGQIVERLMAKQPENRYESAEELAADLDQVLQGGKPTVVVAMEDVIQRMEELARTESAPVRDRRPLVAAMVSGIAAAVCVILFTFALPEIKGAESLAGVQSEDPLLKEARKALIAAETFAKEHPDAIREIRKQLTAIKDGYPPPYPGQAATLLRNQESKYSELSREAATQWLSRAARFQGDGDLVKALLALNDIPDNWMQGSVGSETRKRKDRLAADLMESTGMTLVPGGTFLSGPARTEEHLAAFLIDVTEVSNLEYEQFLKETGHPPPAHWPDGKCPSDLLDHPICGVTFADARAYAQTVGKRLPTALEWEKAARGTDGRVYPWGETFDQKRANCQGLYNGTTPVGKFYAGRSPYNCLDMAGNVHEWTGSVDPLTGDKIIMGGAHRSYLTNVRTFLKLSIDPKHDDARLSVGFRLAKDAAP